MNTEPPTGDDLQQMLVAMKRNVLEHADERRPSRRRHRPGIIVAAVALLALGTASGAVALAVVPQHQTAAPSTSSAPRTPSSTDSSSSAPVVETPTPHPSGPSAAVPARYPNDCRALYSDADRARFFGRTPLTQTPAHPDGTTAPAPAPVQYQGGTWTASTWLDCLWRDPRADVSRVSVTLGSATSAALAGHQDGLRSAGATCSPADGGTVCTRSYRVDPYPVDGTETFWWSDDGEWIDIDQVDVPTSGLLRATIDGMHASTTGTATNGPGTWQITGAGVGPITIGESYQDAVRELSAVMPKTNENCPNPNVAFFESADVTFIVEASNGKVDGISVSGLTTTAGVGVGETIEHLKAVYPNLVRIVGSRDDTTDAFSLWGFRDGARSVTFEMDVDGRYTTGVWVGDAPAPPYEYCG
jgi:hypothetical protein